MHHDEDGYAHPVGDWPAYDPDTIDLQPDTPDALKGKRPLPSLRNLIGHGGRLAPVPGGRRQQLLLRFTPAELAEVTERAAAYELAPAAFAHITARFFQPTARALHRLRPPMSRQDMLDLAVALVPLKRTLSGIGANLNQLARAVNAGDAALAAQLTATAQYAERVFARIEDWLDRLDPNRFVHRRTSR